MLSSVVELAEGTLVKLGHREERAEAFIQARLGVIAKLIDQLDDVFGKVADSDLKTHLMARLGRANNTTQEWDTVMTELYTYMFLTTRSDKKSKDKIRACAEDAFKHRHTHGARGKTQRPGHVN